jgi:hypothetical protein
MSKISRYTRNCGIDCAFIVLEGNEFKACTKWGDFDGVKLDGESTPRCHYDCLQLLYSASGLLFQAIKHGIECPTCDGYGLIVQYSGDAHKLPACSTCNGTGILQSPEMVEALKKAVGD